MIIGDIANAIWDAMRWTWHDPDGYNFISGPLADVTLLGAGYGIYRKHNCHAKHCLRIGRHPVAGTGYIVCRKHHPHDTPTAEQILAAHSAFVAKEAATPTQPAAVTAPPDAAAAAGTAGPVPDT